MDEKDLEAIGGLLDKKLDQKLQPIQETLDSHTASLIKIEKEIKSYMDALDIERKRIDEHDERLEVIEESLGSGV
jgi:DNA repair ATPase RecN